MENWKQIAAALALLFGSLGVAAAASGDKEQPPAAPEIRISKDGFRLDCFDFDWHLSHLAAAGYQPNYVRTPAGPAVIFTHPETGNILFTGFQIKQEVCADADAE